MFTALKLGDSFLKILQALTDHLRVIDVTKLLALERTWHVLVLLWFVCFSKASTFVLLVFAVFFVFENLHSEKYPFQSKLSNRFRFQC